MSIERMCMDCPMRDIEEPEKRDLGISKVYEAEEEGRKIGKARTELGVFVNACRRLRAMKECDTTESDTKYATYEEWFNSLDESRQQSVVSGTTLVEGHWALSDMPDLLYELGTYTIEDQMGET